ncbi:MAG: MFS transporter [Muribaculaceae bacterium]|nr:MFS transporter [Muribaculaceae bacterium]
MESKKASHILPLIILTVAGFTFNTSELIPIGLLTDIASDFGVSEARAGLLITVYAWVVALMSLPLMLLFARMDYRKLMLWVVGVFFVSHIASVLSVGYWSLMASRIGVALAHSLFWSIAPAMAVAVCPPQKRATALSALVAGGGIALIAGLPLGRLLGLVAGWRATFAVLGALAALVWTGLMFRFPPLPQHGETESRRHMLASLIHCKPLLMIYLITAVIVTGHYTGYSYIEPFMAKIAGFGETTITLTLSLFGVAGLMGSFIMSRWFMRYPRALITMSSFGIPVIMLLLLPGATLAPASLAVLCILWGMGMTVYNIAFQNEIISLFPSDSAVPMSFYSGIFNLGIGAGAFVGGFVVDSGRLAHIGYIGGGISMCAAIYCLFLYLPRRRRA